MRKLSFILLATLLICGCNHEEENWPEGSYEHYAKQICGTYVLTKVFWSGFPTDLNGDGISYNDLLENEMKGLPGYYEPNHYANITTAKNGKQSSYKQFVVNLQFPYPDFYMNEKSFGSSRLSYFPQTINIRYAGSRLSSETIHFDNRNYTSIFLSGCNEITLTQITPEELKVRVHCHMYHTDMQSQDLNYLYYCYKRIY